MKITMKPTIDWRDLENAFYDKHGYYPDIVDVFPEANDGYNYMVEETKEELRLDVAEYPDADGIQLLDTLEKLWELIHNETPADEILVYCDF